MCLLTVVREVVKIDGLDAGLKLGSGRVVGCCCCCEEELIVGGAGGWVGEDGVGGGYLVDCECGGIGGGLGGWFLVWVVAEEGTAVGALDELTGVVLLIDDGE